MICYNVESELQRQKIVQKKQNNTCNRLQSYFLIKASSRAVPLYRSSSPLKHFCFAYSMK